VMDLIIGFIVGIVLTFLVLQSIVSNSVKVRISEDTFSKAEIKCEEFGGKLRSFIAYYDKDVFICDDFKIIAKKDSDHDLWISFKKVGQQETNS